MNLEERMAKNVEEAKRELTQKPLFATSAERFLILDELKSAYKQLPQPLRFSNVLFQLLSRVSVPVKPFDLIVGRCVDRELTSAEEERFSRYIRHPDYPSYRLFFASGHGTYSWEYLLEKGLTGLREQAAARCKQTEDEDKKAFLLASVQVYDALIGYALRYAAAAKEQGLMQTAQNLQTIATAPPDSFASALQLLWLVTFVNCAYISENPTLTVGRLDQILYPFYKADIQSGKLTKEQAREYITDYYCKHNLIMGRGEHQVGDETNSTTFQRITNFDAPQYLLLGGKNERGEIVENELTELFAECIQPKFKNPVVVVRYVSDMDKRAPRLWKILCKKALESASLMFYNDDNVYAAFRRIGLPETEARNYAHFGCNWCAPGDNGAWMCNAPHADGYAAALTPQELKIAQTPYMRTNAEHAWPEDFVIVLRELCAQEELGKSVGIDDFYELFLQKMQAFLQRKLAHLSKELALRKRRPSSAMTFGDCFLKDAISSAECFSASAKYHFELQAFQMFGTVADCFIAVDQLVVRQKRLTLKRLLAATDANFVGYEDVLALCRNADKYGSDTPLSRLHTKRLSTAALDLVFEENKKYFQSERLFLVPCMQSDTWHLKMGESFGATPNGRLAGEPFSQNMRPSNGAIKGGLTAMFNDMLQIPCDGLVSGALNLDVQPKQFDGEEGLAVFSALLAAYFNRGGLHAQVSCVNAETLKIAQQNPQMHGDILVRVTGYSGVFVDICKRLQDDIIKRFE